VNFGLHRAAPERHRHHSAGAKYVNKGKFAHFCQRIEVFHMAATCPVCDADVELGADAVEGELVECADCGSELEVTQLDPLQVQEAPEAEEDWGE
jgi:alpha-aminoadipate/glutamate carrier protein LysW